MLPSPLSRSAAALEREWAARLREDMGRLFEEGPVLVGFVFGLLQGSVIHSDYLSGLVIGHELRGLDELRPGLLTRAARVVLVGAPELCDRYRRALGICGLPSPAAAERAAERG